MIFKVYIVSFNNSWSTKLNFGPLKMKPWTRVDDFDCELHFYLALKYNLIVKDYDVNWASSFLTFVFMKKI